MNDISILSTNVNSYTKQQHKQDRTLNFSDLFNQKTKEKISEPSQELANFTYTTSSQNSLTSLNFNDLQAYGYTVDKAGFMGADFNKAASLPQDFKIHKSTLDELNRFAERNHVLNRIKSKDEQIKIFDNIDMTDTIKHYYRLFDQMTSALGDDKKSYTLADIGKLPKGYSTKGTHYDAKGHLLKDLSSSTISNIYSSSATLNDISSTGEHKEYFVDFEKVGKDNESIKALIKERLKELAILMYARSKNTSAESVASNEYEKFKPTREDINSLANSWSERISSISKTFA